MRVNRQWRQLAVDHDKWVRGLALQVRAKVAPCVPLDDLIGVGRMAMIAMARRYNPKICPTFSSFALKRVHGSMMDALNRSSSGMDYRLMMAGPESEAEQFDPSPTPELLLLRSELRRQMENALHCLTPLELDVLKRRSDGETYASISARHGRGINWAFLVTRSAKNKMKVQLGKMHIDLSHAI